MTVRYGDDILNLTIVLYNEHKIHTLRTLGSLFFGRVKTVSAIAGIYHFNNEPINLQHGKIVMTALEKYPADDIATWHDDHVFLGCHAQWITPESINEPLPYYHSESQVVITADAIIDNRKELFDQLQVKPEDRNEMSDSQLILLSYLKWGEECPKFLIGDFAFMIWDQRNRKLFGARDFSGSRTLYFHRNGEKFAFCTTIEPLLDLPYVEKKLNEQWLAEFLAIPTNFESVDLNSTVYTSIEQVPPSHSITVTEDRIRFFRYSLLKPGKTLKLKSNEEYEEAFLEVFKEAVSARLRTYKEVGAHLSGGLDSGSVASVAARQLRNQNKTLHTYSYVPVEGFEDWTPRSRVADERPFIQSTVDFVGNIDQHFCDFKGKTPYSEVDDWLDALEMPYKFYENSYWIKGIYEQASSDGINIMLSGQRGNWTISWGHALDYQALLFKKLKWISLAREIRRFSQRIGVKQSRIVQLVGKKSFPNINRILSTNEEPLPMLINPDFAKRMNVLSKLKKHDVDITGLKMPNAFEMRNKQFEELYYWSVSGTFSTKLSLRHAIVDRDPTNDLRVIDFCQSVPEEQYVQDGQTRSLIRRSMKDYLPDIVRLNQKIRGIQGTDGIYRMLPIWEIFIQETEQMSQSEIAANYFNIDLINHSLHTLKENPQPKNVFDDEFRTLMRCFIVYRFLKKIT